MGIVQKASFKLTIVSYAGAILGAVNQSILFTNFLTTDKVGLINLLMSISIMYAQLSALGMSSISMRFFPFFNDREKKHNGFLFWANMMVFSGFILMTILLWLFKPFIISHYSKDSPMLATYYNYLMPLALSLALFQLYDTYLRSLLKTVISTILVELIIRIGITLCITLYALKIITFPQFVDLYVVGYCSITLILIVYVAFLKQLHIAPMRSRLFKRLFKPILLYGVFTILSSLGASILRNVDSIMVTGMLGLSKTGIYMVVAFFPVMMTLPFRSLQRIVYPLVARHFRAKNMEGVKELYQKTTAVTMVMGGILFLGIWVNLTSIFSFMPKDYSAGKFVFLFLAIATYVDMITGLNGIIMITSKKYKYDLWFMFLLVILTVGMNLIFIPLYGITGAAIATASSVVIFNIARLIFVYYFFKMQPFKINCLWILVVTLIIFTVTFLIPQTGNRFINIFVNSAIVTILYGAAIILLKLSPDVNDYLAKFFKPKRSATN